MKITVKKATKVGTIYLVRVYDKESGLTDHKQFPTLKDARKYAKSFNPYFVTTILKPIEYYQFSN